MVLDVEEREKELKSFVNNYFSQVPYKIMPMQGDAGLRNYYRVITNSNSFVVMDCPPSYAGLTPFIDVASFLTSNNFSAPYINAYDIEQGFMILEDFGKTSIKQYLENINGDTKERKNIYCLIIDLLCALQEKECPDYLKNFDNELLLSEIEVFTSWYIPYEYNRELTAAELDDLKEIWRNILAQQHPMPKSIVLRDYHLENMMYLKTRDSYLKIGLLDFQDALCGSPIYDLVSVLEDARVDVSLEEARELTVYYAQKKQYDIDSVLCNYHILGAQRNLRILGVFAKKYVRDKNGDYLKYIPRVKNYLENDLSHPNLSHMLSWLNNLK